MQCNPVDTPGGFEQRISRAQGVAPFETEQEVTPASTLYIKPVLTDMRSTTAPEHLAAREHTTVPRHTAHGTRSPRTQLATRSKRSDPVGGLSGLASASPTKGVQTRMSPHSGHRCQPAPPSNRSPKHQRPCPTRSRPPARMHGCKVGPMRHSHNSSLPACYAPQSTATLAPCGVIGATVCLSLFEFR